MAAGGENRRRMFHRLAEIAGNRGHGRKEQVAETVSAQSFAGREAVLEQPRQQRFLLRKRDNAAAHVAGSGQVQFFAQAPAGSAIVAYRHNRGQVGDRGKESLLAGPRLPPA